MNEVEKMYENADIKTLKDCKHYLRGDGNWCNDTCNIDKGQGSYSDICYLGDNHDKNDTDRLKCPYCEVKNFGYPPFTAEKQIELVKFLMEQEDFSWTIARQGKNIEYAFYVGYEHSSGGFKEFTEALAGIINNLWQDLTEKERKQIKEILG